MTSDGTTTWREVVAGARATLADAGVGDPGTEARRLVEEASGYEGAELVTGLDRPATQRTLAHLDAMVARRSAGEPLPYVLGRWGFRTVDLLVDRRVLIPRPETEHVAGIALDELQRCSSVLPRALDLGTGSGAIALSLAAEHAKVEVVGTERSPGALAVARANLAGLGRPGARVQLVEGDWYAALEPGAHERFDVIVSNPPYVADADDLPASVRDWEPPSALFAGADGLDDIRTVVAGAPRWLRRPGTLVVELAPAQAAPASALADAAFDDVEVRSDQYGLPRALVARLHAEP